MNTDWQLVSKQCGEFMQRCKLALPRSSDSIPFVVRPASGYLQRVEAGAVPWQDMWVWSLDEWGRFVAVLGNLVVSQRFVGELVLVYGYADCSYGSGFDHMVQSLDLILLFERRLAVLEEPACVLVDEPHAHADNPQQ